MIPKIIHYCWLSGEPYPSAIQECIDTWKDKLTGYRFIIWDTERFDIGSNVWVKQAYESKKYAFAADYIRLYALYNYGGIYLDTDVEIIKSFDDLLCREYFIGADSQGRIEAAIIGAQPGQAWIGECLDYYDNRKFILSDNKLDMKTLPIIMQEIIEKKFSIQIEDSHVWADKANVFHLMPYDYFCSKSHATGKIQKTYRTYTVHHFAMSWQSSANRFLTHFKRILVHILGNTVVDWIVRIFKLKKLKKLLD